MPSKRKSSACVDYVPALCTHRPSLLPIEWLSEASGAGVPRNWDSGKTGQTWSFRGSKSRNKVSVGEPAEGSLQNMTVAAAEPDASRLPQLLEPTPEREMDSTHLWVCVT